MYARNLPRSIDFVGDTYGRGGREWIVSYSALYVNDKANDGIVVVVDIEYDNHKRPELNVDWFT